MTTHTDLLPGTSAPFGTPAPHSRRLARRSGAVFAGLLTIFAVTTATDLLLHATGVFPPFSERMSDALFLLAAAYRVPYGIAGSYLTARLAPDHPLQHALTLGAIGVALSTAGAIAMWDCGPAWYSLAIIAIALPSAWLGGKLRTQQLERTALR